MPKLKKNRATAREEAAVASSGERSGPVTLAEALERLLPHYDDNLFEVADWLNLQHRTGRILLLANGVTVSPSANPPMLGIAAYRPPAGNTVLYVQVRQALDNCQVWEPGGTAEILEQHHQFWTFDRESFETHLPGPPKGRGGRRPEFVIEDLLVEALIYADVAGGLPKAMTGEGSLYEKLESRLGSRCPQPSRFCEIFGPIYQRIKAERRR